MQPRRFIWKRQLPSLAMLEAIAQDSALFAISARDCRENNVGIAICDTLLCGGDLDDERIKILKVDRHYSTCNLGKPPKSIDCLIAVKCRSGGFELTLVELKDVSSIGGIRPRDILEKFRITIERFMSQDFGYVFNNTAYEIARVRAWLVADPFNLSDLPDEVYRRKVGTTRLKAFQSAAPFVFRGHRVLIEMLRPTPQEPEICSC